MKILNDIECNLNWIEGRLSSQSTHNTQGRKYLECTEEIAHVAMLVSVSSVDGPIASVAIGSCCTTCVSQKGPLTPTFLEHACPHLRFPHFSDMLAHISDVLQNKTIQNEYQ